MSNSQNIYDGLAGCRDEIGAAQNISPDGLPVIPPLPERPRDLPADGAIAVCGLCGLRLQRVMGYVCHRDRCGVFPRVTCSTGAAQ